MWATITKYNQLNLNPKGAVCLVIGKPTLCSPHSFRAFYYEQAKETTSSRFCNDLQGFTERPKMEKVIKPSKNSLYLYEKQIQQGNIKQNNPHLQRNERSNEA